MRFPTALLNPSRTPARRRSAPIIVKSPANAKRAAEARHAGGIKRAVDLKRAVGAKNLVKENPLASNRQRGHATNVLGMPPMRLVRAGGGGTKTLLLRTMQHAELLNDSDLATLKRLMEGVETSARSMSRGGLARRKGRSKSIGRGTSTNARSGRLARSWGSRLERQKSGVTLTLSNSAGHAAFLAFGTKHMPAHGPFKAALKQHLGAIDSEWRRLGRVASARQAAHAQVVGGAVQRARSGS